jgi:hypothetical protein
MVRIFAYPASGKKLKIPDRDDFSSEYANDDSPSTPTEFVRMYSPYQFDKQTPPRNWRINTEMQGSTREV